MSYFTLLLCDVDVHEHSSTSRVDKTWNNTNILLCTLMRLTRFTSMGETWASVEMYLGKAYSMHCSQDCGRKCDQCSQGMCCAAIYLGCDLIVISDLITMHLHASFTIIRNLDVRTQGETLFKLTRQIPSSLVVEHLLVLRQLLTNERMLLLLALVPRWKRTLRISKSKESTLTLPYPKIWSILEWSLTMCVGSQCHSFYEGTWREEFGGHLNSSQELINQAIHISICHEWDKFPHHWMMAFIRGSGAYGLRSVTENILMETMFVVPSIESMYTVYLDGTTVHGERNFRRAGGCQTCTIGG